MIEFEKAKELAELKLKVIEEKPNIKLVIVEDETIEFESGFYLSIKGVY